jgi:hypothetical protein
MLQNLSLKTVFRNFYFLKHLGPQWAAVGYSLEHTCRFSGSSVVTKSTVGGLVLPCLPELRYAERQNVEIQVVGLKMWASLISLP